MNGKMGFLDLGEFNLGKGVDVFQNSEKGSTLSGL